MFCKESSFSNYLYQGGYVMPCICMSVHLSVCLLSTLLKHHWTDLCENFTTVISVNEEELIKFWKLAASGSRSRNFWRILQHCEIGHFCTIWLICPEILIGSSSKFYHRCILDNKVLVKFWKLSGSGVRILIWTLDLDQIALGGGICSYSALVFNGFLKY